MQSKKVMVILVLGMLIPWSISAQVSQGKMPSKAEIAKKIQFMKALYKTYDFTSSYDYSKASETLGHFFTEPIYKKLTGNDLVGFQYDQGFTFAGNSFTLKELKVNTPAEKYRKYFTDSLREVSKQAGFAIAKQSGYELGICLIAVVEKMSNESLPGVVLELYAKNLQTSKTIFLRIKSGSRQGWYEGMKNSWKYIYMILKGSTGKNGK